MLLRKFRQTGPDVLILIVVVFFLTWLGAFLHPVLPSALEYDEKPMPLFRILLTVTDFSPFFSVVAAFLLTLLVSYLLVNFNTSAFFISERTFLPAIVYALLTAVFPEFQVLNPVLPAAVFLILGIRSIVASYKVYGTAFSFFDAGILIGTGSLFFAPLIWMGILLLAGIVILRTVNIKEIIISILGIATPLFIVYGIMYVSGKDMAEQLSAVSWNLFGKELSFHVAGVKLAIIIIAVIMILIAVAQLLPALNMKKIKSRKTLTLLFWTFFIALGITIFSGSVSGEMHWLLIIPPSYFLTHYFVFSRAKRIPGIIMTLLFLLAAAAQAAYYFQ
ncbi:MAG: DUF6427 family protein [Bacteroidales bacterium]|jgi:hypothetical protein|nr:DUF6427 family protein [Bacteroidales bacterium]